MNKRILPLNHLTNKNQLVQVYLAERSKTEDLCQPLAIEDYVVQSINDVSPPKWHLAHTTWFFETFLLIPYLKNYRIFNHLFHHLFNSYYAQIGNPFPRVKRGVLSRPTVETIYAYRKYVDKAICDLIDRQSEEHIPKVQSLITLGIHHEQQHQELLLMDIKHNFSMNLDFPIYKTAVSHSISKNSDNGQWIEVQNTMTEMGHTGEYFCFDNELPRHQVILKPYAIYSHLVTNEEYCEFIDAGGYKNPKWWLSDGWDCIQENDWEAPLYWQRVQNEWYSFTLHGFKEINPKEPVCHVSYYEAYAYARWRGLRLPTEAEWEHFVCLQALNPQEGTFLESNCFHPQIPQHQGLATQFFGDVWQWTESAYSAYPGYKPIAGALGEYNGKFMSNQIVLRGGSCVTPKAHIRYSYRNFFQPDKRWQFSGIRLINEN